MASPSEVCTLLNAPFWRTGQTGWHVGDGKKARSFLLSRHENQSGLINKNNTLGNNQNHMYTGHVCTAVKKHVSSTSSPIPAFDARVLAHVGGQSRGQTTVSYIASLLRRGTGASYSPDTAASLPQGGGERGKHNRYRGSPRKYLGRGRGLLVRRIYILAQSEVDDEVALSLNLKHGVDVTARPHIGIVGARLGFFGGHVPEKQPV